MVKDINSYYFDGGTIANSAGTQIATGPTELVGIFIGLTSASVIGIIDGTSGTTANVLQLKASPSEGWYQFGAKLANGLRIVSLTNGGHLGKVTVVYRQ